MFAIQMTNNLTSYKTYSPHYKQLSRRRKYIASNTIKFGRSRAMKILFKKDIFNFDGTCKMGDRLWFGNNKTVTTLGEETNRQKPEVFLSFLILLFCLVCHSKWINVHMYYLLCIFSYFEMRRWDIILNNSLLKNCIKKSKH